MIRRTFELTVLGAALLVAALAVHAWLAARDEQQRLAATLAAQKQIIDAADASERANQSSLASALAQIEKLKRTTQTPEQILQELSKYLPLPQPLTLASGSDSAARSEQGTNTPANSLPANAAALSSRSGTTAELSQSRGQGFLAPSEAERSSAASDRVQRDTALPKAVAEPNRAEQQNASRGAACDAAGNCVAQIPVADLKPLFDYVQDCRACQAELAASRQDAADDATKIAALTRERDAAVTAAKGGTFLRRLRRNALWFAIGAAGGYVAAKH